MVEHQTSILNSNHLVHGWLMDVPGYRDNYRNERHLKDLNVINETDEFSRTQKERPTSLASISSRDSINLDELINANFTTDMDDETDLTALAALDLDDSNEDFWKIDTMLNHLVIPGKPNDSNRSKSSNSSEEDFDSSKNSTLEDLHDASYYNVKKVTERSFLDTTLDSFDTVHDSYVKPISKQQDSSLLLPKPHNPQQRLDRSGSFSSDNSANSQSTVTTSSRPSNHNHIYPSTSTSTSSLSSHSTTNSSLFHRSAYHSSSNTTSSSFALPENKLKSNKSYLHRRPSLASSISETSSSITSSDSRLPSSRTQIGLARRASHIPAPSSHPATTKLAYPNAPQHTKSTATLKHKASTGSLTRSASRIGQPASSRGSHIPTPPARSTTSLGISSIFSSTSPPKQQNQQQQIHRPKTSMGSLKSSPSKLRSGLRTPTITPASSKSSGLKMPNSRSLYKK